MKFLVLTVSSQISLNLRIDLAVNDVFMSSHSLLASLRKSLSQRKVHKNANVKIFELIQHLIEKYNKRICQYAKAVLEVSLRRKYRKCLKTQIVLFVL